MVKVSFHWYPPLNDDQRGGRNDGYSISNCRYCHSSEEYFDPRNTFASRVSFRSYPLSTNTLRIFSVGLTHDVMDSRYLATRILIQRNRYGKNGIL